MPDSHFAASGRLKPIAEVAASLGLHPEELIPYGRFKAKVALTALDRLMTRPLGRYVLVTAMNPTPLGEGKTTTAIGLAMGLTRKGLRSVVTLRQPSLGPVFGLKGGGTGGGRAQIHPMEDINLHLTGDAHAVAAGHNLLAAFLDNHLFHGNRLEIDPERVMWPRAIGISDRALRRILLGSDGEARGRQGQFVITEASEVMAILALASGHADLRQRLGRMIVASDRANRLIRAEDLKCAGAMAVLLKDSLGPNVVQTSEGTPALVHAGPFGNIAHGNCSILADTVALHAADIVVTEAGFGSDLGAEKFFNIKCRVSGFRPDVAVLVATLRALKLHGGGGVVKAGQPLPPGLTGPNEEALEKGLGNLDQHISNVRSYGVPLVVAINAFPGDPERELEYVRRWAVSHGAAGGAVSTHWQEGGRGAAELADAVIEACRQPSSFRFLYSDAAPIKEKIEIIARRMYGADGVAYEGHAEAQIELAQSVGMEQLPVCMAKTPLSLSHDAALKGRPRGFTVPIKEVRLLAGAGFLTAVCSGIQLMPGLPKQPAGERIDLDPVTGDIGGLS